MVIIKRLVSNIAFVTILIILLTSNPVHGELVTFERTEDDITFNFEVNYDKYLANEAETSITINIDLPIYPAELTDCRLTSFGISLVEFGNEGFPIFDGSYIETNDFLDISDYTFSVSFTPSALEGESPDGYFANSFIKLSFFIVLGFNDNPGSAMNSQVEPLLVVLYKLYTSSVSSCCQKPTFSSRKNIS